MTNAYAENIIINSDSYNSWKIRSFCTYLLGKNLFDVFCLMMMTKNILPCWWFNPTGCVLILRVTSDSFTVFFFHKACFFAEIFSMTELNLDDLLLGSWSKSHRSQQVSLEIKFQSLLCFYEFCNHLCNIITSWDTGSLRIEELQLPENFAVPFPFYTWWER